jgi:hypothetical protein
VYQGPSHLATFRNEEDGESKIFETSLSLCSEVWCKIKTIGSHDNCSILEAISPKDIYQNCVTCEFDLPSTSNVNNQNMTHLSVFICNLLISLALFSLSVILTMHYGKKINDAYELEEHKSIINTPFVEGVNYRPRDRSPGSSFHDEKATLKPKK